ncbi:hypothetical protein AGABI2DRAFT_179887, partial [Agaricus bisporus var. bisporus H97]|uniref:hypothetical protein n=1 Tax=Agaricus bisporus var. bisporus (strain H97 / ATCC MYA-4626 / FGSC 10389) TaxID=936046 RepID=UPI00029F50F6
MLSSKIFSLLIFTAAAVAEGFPKGQFHIAHVQYGLVLTADTELGRLSPHPLIFLAVRDPDNDAQIWTYTEDRRFLTNEASQFVLEVPRTDGGVNYGTKLQEALPRDEANDDLTQLWGYNAKTQHLFTLADTTACITANESLAFAVVDSCDSRVNDSQRWRFINV